MARNTFGSQLSRDKVMSTLAEMDADLEKFRVLYTMRARGMTTARVEAVRAWNKDGDTLKLMKRTGITNQAIAFKLIGQVNDFLKRSKPSFNAYDDVAEQEEAAA